MIPTSVEPASPAPSPDNPSISDFENPEDATYVRWKHAGHLVYKQYANVAHAVVLASQKGVVVVEPYQKHPTMRSSTKPTERPGCSSSIH